MPDEILEQAQHARHQRFLEGRRWQPRAARRAFVETFPHHLLHTLLISTVGGSAPFGYPVAAALSQRSRNDLFRRYGPPIPSSAALSHIIRNALFMIGGMPHPETFPFIKLTVDLREGQGPPLTLAGPDLVAALQVTWAMRSSHLDHPESSFRLLLVRSHPWAAGAVGALAGPASL